MASSSCTFKNILKCDRFIFLNKLMIPKSFKRMHHLNNHSDFINVRTSACQVKELSSFHRYFCTKEDFKASDVQKLLDNAASYENESEENWTPDNVWATSPYPKGVANHRHQSRHALRPRIDPRATSLILFPGEGSQYVGMAGNLLTFPGVKDIFAAANDILKYDLLSLCLQGPKSRLDETRYSQVAVMVCSFAALEKLKEERPNSVDSCMATGGFGIGELTALTFAGVLSFERAVRLAQLRGEAMQTASEMEPGGLLMVMYNPITKLHPILVKAKEHAQELGIQSPVCDVAHYLFPHCKVIGGHIECLRFIEKNYRTLKLDKVRRLNTEGAHYTSMMQPAAMTFKKYLERSNLSEPVIAVHSTIDGKVYKNKEDVARNLHKQITKPIKWEQMMHVLYERPVGFNFPSTFEVGPGNTLKTLLKMVNAKAYDTCFNVFDSPTV